MVLVKGHLHILNCDRFEVDLELRLFFLLLTCLFLFSTPLFLLESINDKLEIGRLFRRRLEELGM